MANDISARIVEATYSADRKFREEARRVWKELTAYVASNELQSAESRTRRGIQYGFYAKGPDGGLPLGLGVMLLSGNEAARGSFSNEKPLGPLIKIHGIVDDPNDSRRLADEMPRYQKIFIHEYVHYKDVMRGARTGQARGMSGGGDEDFNEYIRTPEEFNAWYQEIASQVEDYFLKVAGNAARATHPRLKSALQGRLESKLKSFAAFRLECESISAGDDFSFQQAEEGIRGTKWGRKWDKRLYGLYRGIRAKVKEMLSED